PAALFGGKSLQSFLRGVTCPLESQPMPQVASIWERPANWIEASEAEKHQPTRPSERLQPASWRSVPWRRVAWPETEMACLTIIEAGRSALQGLQERIRDGRVHLLARTAQPLRNPRVAEATRPDHVRPGSASSKPRFPRCKAASGGRRSKRPQRWRHHPPPHRGDRDGHTNHQQREG